MNEAQASRIGVNADPNLLISTDSQNSSTAPASTPTTANGAGAKADPYPWILNPTVDLLFACGGLFWPLFLFVALTGAKFNFYGSNADFTLAFFGVMGIHLFGDSHQPATLWRVYFSKSTREKLWKPVTALAAVAVGIGALIINFPTLAGAGVKLILLASIQHQLAQSYGVSLIYCYKRRYYMTKTEKNITLWLVQSAIAFIVVKMLTNKEWGSAHLNGMDVPFWQVLPDSYATVVATVALVVLQVMVLLFAGMVVRKYIKEKRIFPLPAMMVLLTLIVMPFVAGGSFSLLWIWIGSYWFHSSQYLVVTSSFYFKERGLPENVSVSQIGRMLLTTTSLKYFGSVFCFGLFIALLLPNWIHQFGGVGLPIAMSAVYVAANMHHFITDSFIWKLRDPQVQKLLVA